MVWHGSKLSADTTLESEWRDLNFSRQLSLCWVPLQVIHLEQLCEKIIQRLRLKVFRDLTSKMCSGSFRLLFWCERIWEVFQRLDEYCFVIKNGIQPLCDATSSYFSFTIVLSKKLRYYRVYSLISDVILLLWSVQSSWEKTWILQTFWCVALWRTFFVHLASESQKRMCLRCGSISWTYCTKITD